MKAIEFSLYSKYVQCSLESRSIHLPLEVKVSDLA
jgi:hypothetical protein